MSTSIIEPGTRLAGRYRLEEKVREAGGSTLWRAIDEILARAVAVRTFDPEFSRIGEVVTAARAASRLTDPRLSQVFDADDSGEQAYVVSEWVTGDTLEEMISGSGPLEPGRAATLLCEASEAIAAAHAAGLSHLRLTPRDLLWTTGGTVKLLGIGVDAALAGVTSTDPGPVDAKGLGHLLYAGLTGHWGGDTPSSLPPAPMDEGQVCPPRQVTSGISFAMDTLVCRVLGLQAMPGQEPLNSPAALAKALTGVPRTPLPLFAGLNPGPPPSVIPRQPRETGASPTHSGTPGGATAQGRPAPATSPAPPPRSRGVRNPTAARPVQQPAPHQATQHGAPQEQVAAMHTAAPAGFRQGATATFQGDNIPTRATATGGGVNRPLVAAAAALAALIVGFGAWQLNGDSDPSGKANQQVTPSKSSTPKPSSTKLTPVSADGFDTNPAVHPDNKYAVTAALAIDGKSSTSWETQSYNTAAYGKLKKGLGLVLDLGKPVNVSKVRVTMPSGTGGSLELRAGDEKSFGALKVIGEKNGALSGTFDLSPDTATKAQYVLLWVTQLPSISDGFKARISTVTVYGSES